VQQRTGVNVFPTASSGIASHFVVGYAVSLFATISTKSPTA
jgi:hypothetical protein